MYQCFELVDPQVKCPYNKNHLIAKSRLQWHIIKCEKQYPHHFKVMCPYNATHRLFRSELDDHIIKCPMRTTLDTTMYSDAKKHGATNFPMPSDNSSIVNCNENWDLESDSGSVLMIEDDRSCFSNNDEGTSNQTGETNFRPETKASGNEKIRAPHGYSEVMLRENTEDPIVEDTESIVSSMGIGRGRVINNLNKLQILGLQRRKLTANKL